VADRDRPVLICGVWLDVTEQKRAEQQLRSLHEQLLDTSRRAGMAEVATGVLHNVGNVLNSVNVSATLIRDRLNHSRVSSVAKAAAMLVAHQADLPAFLTVDPKGKLLPGYLEGVTAHMQKEQQNLIQEADLLAKHVDHIKNIVAMQQSYARVSGAIESLSPAALVEDALLMNMAALRRHEVEVVRQYEPVPPVAVDKHRVMQILLNLIRNAKHAMDEHGNGTIRKLELGIQRQGPDWVVITVRDNGVGIKPEDLTRIFAHGFTTKKDGHGFGLHLGALAAKEMGGELRVESAGPGQGASFRLELPVAKEKAAT